MKEANATETGSTIGSSMTDEVLSISIGSRHDQQWLLDSGASNHMCLHRHWFITYQSIDDGIVYMGNDISCKVVGIGSIRIKMFDGTIKILTDVIHVPEHRKNLISLGVLDTWRLQEYCSRWSYEDLQRNSTGYESQEGW
jgi:hypothetical protein